MASSTARKDSCCAFQRISIRENDFLGPYRHCDSCDRYLGFEEPEPGTEAYMKRKASLLTPIEVHALMPDTHDKTSTPRSGSTSTSTDKSNLPRLSLSLPTPPPAKRRRPTPKPKPTPPPPQRRRSPNHRRHNTYYNQNLNPAMSLAGMGMPKSIAWSTLPSRSSQPPKPKSITWSHPPSPMEPPAPSLPTETSQLYSHHRNTEPIDPAIPSLQGCQGWAGNGWAGNDLQGWTPSNSGNPLFTAPTNPSATQCEYFEPDNRFLHPGYATQPQHILQPQPHPQSHQAHSQLFYQPQPAQPQQLQHNPSLPLLPHQGQQQQPPTSFSRAGYDINRVRSEGKVSSCDAFIDRRVEGKRARERERRLVSSGVQQTSTQANRARSRNPGFNTSNIGARSRSRNNNATASQYNGQQHSVYEGTPHTEAVMDNIGRISGDKTTTIPQNERIQDVTDVDEDVDAEGELASDADVQIIEGEKRGNVVSPNCPCEHPARLSFAVSSKGEEAEVWSCALGRCGYFVRA